MWNGPPEDVAGQCNARLIIGDDYGDNSSTFRCQLEPGHEGMHEESFVRSRTGGKVSIHWEEDETAICPRCHRRAEKVDMEGGVCCFTCPRCRQDHPLHHRDLGSNTICGGCAMEVEFLCLRCGKRAEMGHAAVSRQRDDGSWEGICNDCCDYDSEAAYEELYDKKQEPRE